MNACCSDDGAASGGIEYDTWSLQTCCLGQKTADDESHTHHPVATVTPRLRVAAVHLGHSVHAFDVEWKQVMGDSHQNAVHSLHGVRV